RSRGVGQPVQRDVVQDVVAGQAAGGLPAGEGAGALLVAVGVVVEDPSRQPGRRIGQGIADGFWRLALLGGITLPGLRPNAANAACSSSVNPCGTGARPKSAAGTASGGLRRKLR